MDMKFYRCNACGKIVANVKESDSSLICCGEEMKPLIPQTMETGTEKHQPVWEMVGNKVYVTVGSMPHPMTEEHHIEWIAVQTKQGNQRKKLEIGAEPRACFALCHGDEVEAVYAFCNLHMLWKAKEGAIK